MALIEVKTAFQHYWKDDKGFIQGEYKQYHQNGQLWVHAFVVNDMEQGEYKEWYDNGQCRHHEYELDGEKHGEAKFWGRDGQLIEHAIYVNGELLEGIDPAELTGKEKFALTLRYGISWL